MQSPCVLRRASIASVGLALTLSTTVLLSACRGADAKGKPSDATTPVLVRPVTRLNRADYVALSGEAEALRTVNVGFLVPGLVRTVNLKEGDAVDTGQVLAELDPTDYQLNVDLAAAQLDRAEDEFARAKSMFDKKGIPAEDFNKAEIAARMARTQASMARKKLGDTRLASPLAGIVARRGVEPGEQTGPGVPAFTVMQVDPLQIRIGVPESEIARFAVGQRADVRIPSLQGASFSGVVRLVGIAADPASRTYTVKAEVPNPAHRLRPGMIAEVRIENGGKLAALTIPAEAIVRDVDGVTHVFVYDPGEQRVRSQRVEVGDAYGTEIEVRSGLKADDVIVTGGQHRVRDGSRVSATVDSASRGKGGASSAP
ncbi:MAG: efflux RND transporter periplasmic adaptor subunit [Gemmatimonadales bacterium]